MQHVFDHARVRVPDSPERVNARRGHVVAVRREGDVDDAAGMGAEEVKGITGPHIPDTRIEAATSHDEVATRSKGRTRHGALRVSERGNPNARRDVEDIDSGFPYGQK